MSRSNGADRYGQLHGTPSAKADLFPSLLRKGRKNDTLRYKLTESDVQMLAAAFEEFDTVVEISDTPS